MVSRSVFIMDNLDGAETIYETNFGQILNPAICESLIPGIWVDATIIDIWAMILNEEQKLKDGQVKRVVLQTSTISKNMWDGSLSFDKAYKMFDSNMKHALGFDDAVLSLKNVELVFSLIIAHEHYYLVVFNLKKTRFMIIDSSAATNVYKGKYGKVCNMLKRMFCCYLRNLKHEQVPKIIKMKHTVATMKWRTLNNKDDCGIFLMCHMDTYTGETISKWNTGFVRGFNSTS